MSFACFLQSSFALLIFLEPLSILDMDLLSVSVMGFAFKLPYMSHGSIETSPF